MPGIRHESLSSWRAWIEIGISRYSIIWHRSLSSWRAWIEMIVTCRKPESLASRSPHGERGLKYRLHHGQVWIAGGRSPHGERGLKSVSASFRPPRGCCSPCLCPVFPAHAGFHMCGTASNGKPGFLSARGDFNGNTSRNCDWVFRMGSLLKAM